MNKKNRIKSIFFTTALLGALFYTLSSFAQIDDQDPSSDDSVSTGSGSPRLGQFEKPRTCPCVNSDDKKDLTISKSVDSTKESANPGASTVK